MPEQPFSVSGTRHRLLGKQIELQLARDFVLKFTPAEASSLSFALVAVRDGISPEREIYMSPIASDEAFVGTVLDHGISIAMPVGALELNWSKVGLLAESLAAAIA
ncbi:hypothetical protein [Sideroxydans sp. CL21]|uniref:hypothetical protein n=1 Tax=Sideroxydans sp. CL21 TaxID=2600596 RepID=UPI0024BC6CE5|nr:hypothetical protein [Sideroxydans sp. CL21]